MSVSKRVAAEPFSDDADFEGDYAIDFVLRAKRKRWRIYEYHSGYSQVSGGITQRGLVVRRYDPEARDLEGKIAEFDTLEDARMYVNRWLILPKKGK